MRGEKGEVGKLADGDGGVVDKPDEAYIAKDFSIVPDHKMGDDCPNHGREEQAAGIKQEGKGERGEEEVQKNTDPANHFDQGDGSNNGGSEVGHPAHTLGKHFDRLKKTDSSAQSKDNNENDLCGWLKVGHSIRT